jgi:MYXO-CTERM domain-containing protein
MFGPTHICRPAMGQCDVADVCDGSNPACNDLKSAVGTMCSDGNPCTIGDMCATGGICNPGGPNPACNPDAGVPDAAPVIMIDAASGVDASHVDANGGADAGMPEGPQGCSCRVGAHGHAPSSAWMLLIVGGIVLRLQRRRRR